MLGFPAVLLHVVLLVLLQNRLQPVLKNTLQNKPFSLLVVAQDLKKLPHQLVHNKCSLLQGIFQKILALPLAQLSLHNNCSLLQGLFQKNPSPTISPTLPPQILPTSSRASARTPSPNLTLTAPVRRALITSTTHSNDPSRTPSPAPRPCPQLRHLITGAPSRNLSPNIPIALELPAEEEEREEEDEEGNLMDEEGQDGEENEQDEEEQFEEQGEEEQAVEQGEEEQGEEEQEEEEQPANRLIWIAGEGSRDYEPKNVAFAKAKEILRSYYGGPSTSITRVPKEV